MPGNKMKKAKYLNITLHEIKPKFNWVLRQWKVYSNNFYLGMIYKRKLESFGHLGRNVDPSEKVFVSHISLFQDDGIYFCHVRKKNWRYGYHTNLADCKLDFKVAFKKLIKSLLNENT